MAKTNRSTGDENLEAIQSSLGKTEQFIEENQKSITIIVAAIIFIVVGYLAYQKFYIAPQEDEAQREIFLAQADFAKDSFQLALNGVEGYYEGFEAIANDYSMTTVGSIANFYAGISHLRLGNYDEAIEYLRNFDSEDEILSTMAIGAIGDAYVEKNELEEAVSYFKKASERKSNEFVTPVYLLKLGLVYEKLAKKDEAKKAYTKLKEEYAKSTEARNVDKYLTRLQY
jgi:tetratricopeptide (TPR) repeat protein